MTRIPHVTHFAHADGTACGNLKPRRITSEVSEVTCGMCTRSPFFLECKPKSQKTTPRAPGVPVGYRVDGARHRGARYF